MDLVSGCKDKLQYFRIKEIKDVLTQLGLSKQGKKQELVERILSILADDQASKMWAKRHAVRKEDVARLVDDTYRKMQISGATDLATKPKIVPESTPVKPKEEIDDSPQVEMKIRCLCGSSLLTESVIKCVDPQCQMLQHITCVIIPEKPMEGIPPVPSQFYCELCRLSRADPFWLTKAHPLYPVKLMITSMPTDGTNPTQGVEKTFQITRLEKDMLSKPEYDIQAWCMLLNDKVPFRMQWPLYADLQVNGLTVRAINRPGSQSLGTNGRDDGPIITPYTKEGINKISLTCIDARLFCVGVRIVKRQNLQQILNMIPEASDGERFEDALARVRRCMNGGGDADNADSDSDLEVVAESFTVNLRCPMLGSRMRMAGRFRPCAHMGCFDLEAFVEMQQRSRKWQCPICLKNYSLEHLIVDPYFNRITNLMRSCGEDTTDIDVKPDGSWRVKGDNVHRNLGQWHFPDSSICGPSEEVKPKLEASELVKQEGNGLKLGIKKNINGVWEVSKPADNLSSGERLQENFTSDGPKVNPLCSSATGSGRECEDTSVNQDPSGNFDFTANAGVEHDYMHLNLDEMYQVSNQNASAHARDAGIIVLSDSDEENVNMALPINSHAHAGGINFSMEPHGLPDAYQEDAALETGGSLDLFNSADDDFGMHLWQLPPVTQAGPSFQLFGSDAAASDTLIGFHQSHMNYPNSMNGYPFAPEIAMNPTSFLPDSTVGHSNNNDIIDMNDGLVDNPLAFGVDDPALQIFLPTRSSESSAQTSLRHQQDSSSGIQSKDWISLRLGDGGGQDQRESLTSNGLNAGHEMSSKEGPMHSSTAAASLFLNDTRSDKTTRQRSDSPISFPRQQRIVKPRLNLSIDTDSE